MDEINLLTELDELLRSMPAKEGLLADDNHWWFGRLSAVMTQLGLVYATKMDLILDTLLLGRREFHVSYRKMMILLHQARAELVLKTTGPTSSLTGTGQVFYYFDEVRKIIELAKSDILFVDPYLDAEFVSKYLPFVASGVSIRLLSGTHKLKTLIPAIKTFAQQSQNSIEVKSNTFHDRFIFIDSTNCYQSGASFKDGAKKAPVTITQITDAITPMISTYENLWTEGTIHN